MPRRGDGVYLRRKTCWLRIIAAIGATVMVVSSAGAECAWVLWTRSVTPSVGSVASEKWQVVDARASESACRSSAESQIQTILASSGQVFRHERLGKTMAVQTYMSADSDPYPVATDVTSFVCLPDTVDPREPKGR